MAHVKEKYFLLVSFQSFHAKYAEGFNKKKKKKPFIQLEAVFRVLL